MLVVMANMMATSMNTIAMDIHVTFTASLSVVGWEMDEIDVCTAETFQFIGEN